MDMKLNKKGMINANQITKPLFVALGALIAVIGLTVFLQLLPTLSASFFSAVTGIALDGNWTFLGLVMGTGASVNIFSILFEIGVFLVLVGIVTVMWVSRKGKYK